MLLNQTSVFIKFLIIGSLIFIFDYIFFIALSFFFENFFLCRFLSYSISTFIAWKLNTKFTFLRQGSFKNYYCGSSIAGIQNIIISFLLSYYVTYLLAIAFGCLYGLFFNFIYQKKITFK